MPKSFARNPAPRRASRLRRHQSSEARGIDRSEQRFFDAGLDALAEECAVGQYQPRAPAGLEDVHQQHQEKIGGLSGAELGREVRLNAVLFHAAEGRIDDDDVHALLRPPVAHATNERSTLGQRDPRSHVGA